MISATSFLSQKHTRLQGHRGKAKRRTGVDSKIHWHSLMRRKNYFSRWAVQCLCDFQFCERLLTMLVRSSHFQYALLTEIIQAQHLTLNLFGHITRMDDNIDAMQILTSSPSVYWKRPPGRPWMTWMKTVQKDLDSHGLSRTEAVDLARTDHSGGCWQPMALRTRNAASQRWWWWWLMVLVYHVVRKLD